MFIAFKNKILILRYIYYPEDFYVNYWLGSDINFNDDSLDYIVIDTVEPANKNSLSFLQLRDVRVRGNYMYVVDGSLNMVIRYNIEFIRTQQGVSSWDKNSIRLMDSLQGEGDASSPIFFN